MTSHILEFPTKNAASGPERPRSEKSMNHLRERRGIPRQILDATRKKFLHYGVNRTTMADIGRELGMPRQALYDYVSSRDGSSATASSYASMISRSYHPGVVNVLLMDGSVRSVASTITQATWRALGRRHLS